MSVWHPVIPLTPFHFTCAAAYTTIVAPADGSCQSHVINNSQFSFKLQCSPVAGVREVPFTWQGWDGAGCNGNNQYTATGSSIAPTHNKYPEGSQYSFYPQQVQSFKCPLITPTTTNNNQQSLPTGFPDRITVHVRGGQLSSLMHHQQR